LPHWDHGRRLFFTKPDKGNYIVLDGSSTTIQITEPIAIEPQPRPRSCYKVYMFFLMHTTKDGVEVLGLSAQYQASSGHDKGNSVVLDGSATIKITEPIAVAPQPRPTPC
jgi:hypothetical protein